MMHGDNAPLLWISGVRMNRPLVSLSYLGQLLSPAKRLVWHVLRVSLIQAEVGERCTRLRKCRSRVLAKPGGNTHLQRTEAYA